MKQIILFRHGKSRWDEPVSDQFRSLTEKGELKTIITAKYLKELIDIDKFVLFSSVATRAKQTAVLCSNVIEYKQNIIFDKELYTFSDIKLLSWIKTLDNNINNIIIFGHNPAFTDFANKYGNIFIENIPTAGAVWLNCKIDKWSLINRKHKTKLIFKPKIKNA